ncbi:MAG: hypothetical protein LBS51_08305 [Oscillospiraceae bacterium]|jgi:hypothetical protein|nr:hypothetical protein [Oscillospiraceae bacterium]
MGIRELIAPPASDLSSYQAPMNYEFAGKTLELHFDGGGTATFAFTDFPSCGVSVDGSLQKLPYHCVKVADTVFFLTYLVRDAYVAITLDSGTGSATRVTVDGGLRIAHVFGAIGSGANAGTHAPAHGLTGVVTWTFGKKASSVFTVAYGDDTAAITSAGIPDALAVSDFSAVRITDAIILQTAIVTAGGRKNAVVLLSNFYNATSAGGVFRVTADEGAVCTPLGGYGRFAEG